MAAPRSESPGPRTVLAFFVAAALLAITGILLLVIDSSRPRPPAVPSAPSDMAGTPSAAQFEPSRPATRPAPAATASAETPSPPHLPLKAVEIASQFVTTWAAHDARPGHDASFSNAGRRAAAFATDEFAAQLRVPGARSVHLWQQWVAHKSRVACVIDRVAIPDGAPTPTGARAYARVLYTCTTRTADQRPISTAEELALELSRSAAGVWRVSAIVNA